MCACICRVGFETCCWRNVQVSHYQRKRDCDWEGYRRIYDGVKLFVSISRTFLFYTHTHPPLCSHVCVCVLRFIFGHEFGLHLIWELCSPQNLKTNGFNALLTTTIFVAQVWKTPHVCQVDRESDNGQQEVRLARPCFALVRIGQQFAARRPWLERLADRGHRRYGDDGVVVVVDGALGVGVAVVPIDSGWWVGAAAAVWNATLLLVNFRKFWRGFSGTENCGSLIIITDR